VRSWPIDAILSLSLLVALQPGCASAEGHAQLPTDFSSIALGTYTKSECSPEFDLTDFEAKGVKLNMPTSVEASDSGGAGVLATRWPACITLRAPKREYPSDQFDEIGAAITLVVVDVKTGQSRAANLASSKSTFGPVSSAAIPEAELDLPRQFYMSVNVCDYLDLPPIPGTYDVHVTFLDYESESIRVEVE
jgi:hypothetical protein